MAKKFKKKKKRKYRSKTQVDESVGKIKFRAPITLPLFLVEEHKQFLILSDGITTADIPLKKITSFKEGDKMLFEVTMSELTAREAGFLD